MSTRLSRVVVAPSVSRIAPPKPESGMRSPCSTGCVRDLDPFGAGAAGGELTRALPLGGSGEWWVLRREKALARPELRDDDEAVVVSVAALRLRSVTIVW